MFRLTTPAPRVGLWEFGVSGAVLWVEYCVHFRGTVDRATVRSEINRRIKSGFEAAGISAPIPEKEPATPK